MSILSHRSFRLPGSEWEFGLLPVAGEHQRGFWFDRVSPRYLTVGFGAVVFSAERRGRLAIPVIEPAD